MISFQAQKFIELGGLKLFNCEFQNLKSSKKVNDLFIKSIDQLFRTFRFGERGVPLDRTNNKSELSERCFSLKCPVRSVSRIKIYSFAGSRIVAALFELLLCGRLPSCFGKSESPFLTFSIFSTNRLADCHLQIVL